MVANFTSVILEHGLLPIAPAIQKRLGLSPGDPVRISIKALTRFERKTAKSRRDELLEEKDLRVLTPAEQDELIALANAKFDAAIMRAKRVVQKRHPELFDKNGQPNMRKLLASLRPTAKQRKSTARKRFKSR
jgi:hypothetical protein